MMLQHPWNVKPPFRFATIPSGATEENIKINFPEMHKYMRKYNKSDVEDGLKAMKSGYVKFIKLLISNKHVSNNYQDCDLSYDSPSLIVRFMIKLLL
ncbi:uncharacterized protein DC041_0003547 [Schistosoma bovis]|uniref:Uncharacterized protein n=1 Tax=Schistosoma bovis TaxID=6184 RepID=A0A430Q868_SCHBO|nr:uncharacterized protein DC041_0003547 [Schistosoma bovis]